MIDVYQHGELPHIICLDYQEPVESWEEYHAAIQQACEIAAKTTQTVYLLHNPDTTPMPDGNPFPHLHQAMQSLPPNVAANLMIIRNVFARRAMELALKISQVDEGYYFVASEADAYHLLESMREHI